MSKHRKSILHWQTVTSGISTTMVLVLMGILVLFVLTAKQIRDYVREDLSITVVLGDGQSSEVGHKVEKAIRRQKYVRKITYISSEQALKEQQEALGLDPTEFLGVNPFPISMEVYLHADYTSPDSLRWIASELRHDGRVQEVTYQKDIIENVNSTLNHISIILLIVTVLLGIISLSLINNTVRMSIYSHRFTINTMKLIGARWNFIRYPFMIHALWVGLVSGIIADALLYGGLQWLFKYNVDVNQFVPQENIAIMAGSVLLVGLILNLVCTFFSVTHYLRKRETELYK